MIKLISQKMYVNNEKNKVIQILKSPSSFLSNVYFTENNFSMRHVQRTWNNRKLFTRLGGSVEDCECGVEITIYVCANYEVFFGFFIIALALVHCIYAFVAEESLQLNHAGLVFLGAMMIIMYIVRGYGCIEQIKKILLSDNQPKMQ